MIKKKHIHPNQKYTDEDLILEAAKFSSKRDWRLYGHGYSQAWERGILEKATRHMKNPKTKWTKEAIFGSLAKSGTWAKWRKEHRSAYVCARTMGILDECRKKTAFLPQRWNVDSVYEESKKYKTIKDWKKNSIGSWSFWMKNISLFPEFCVFPKKIRKKAYSEREILDIASSFSFLHKWNDHPASQAARKRGISEKCTSHMKRIQSAMEIDLRNCIKKEYSDAKKHRFCNDIWPEKQHIKGFELDVYVPSLSVGIEFDGTYYHSPGQLKRGRKTWPDSDLERYHEIKDRFFLEKGIFVIHVKEEDWTVDRDAILKKTLENIRSKSG